MDTNKTTTMEATTTETTTKVSNNGFMIKVLVVLLILSLSMSLILYSKVQSMENQIDYSYRFIQHQEQLNKDFLYNLVKIYDVAGMEYTSDVTTDHFLK